MNNHQVFFKSSCLIDAEVGVPFQHLDLGGESDCYTKQQAKQLLEKLRDRLRSGEVIGSGMSEEDKQRILALLPFK